MGNSLSSSAARERGQYPVEYKITTNIGGSDTRSGVVGGKSDDYVSCVKQKLLDSSLPNFSQNKSVTVSSITNTIPQLDSALPRPPSLFRVFNWKRLTSGRAKKTAAAAAAATAATVESYRSCCQPALDRNKNVSKAALAACNRVQCCRTANSRLDLVSTGVRTIADKSGQNSHTNTKSPPPLPPPPRTVLVANTEQQQQRQQHHQQRQQLLQQTTTATLQSPRLQAPSQLAPESRAEDGNGAADSIHTAEKSSSRHSTVSDSDCRTDCSSSTGNPAATRRNVVQASTSELLQCVALFLKQRCTALDSLQSSDIVLWLRTVDRCLLLQGWQDIAFINPANLVFLYMLLKEMVPPSINCERQLHSLVLNCLYMSYSYMGSEISYPLKPFLLDGSRERFFQQCLQLVQRCSALMLRVNAEPSLFTNLFTDLKAHGQNEHIGEKER